MGAKGCSPDNAAVEGFFGRPRQEFFHKRSFAGVSMDGFIDMLNDYMVWYRDKRIKTEYGTGIMDRRRELGYGVIRKQEQRSPLELSLLVQRL